MKTLPSLVTAGLIVFSSTSHGTAVEQDWGAIAITGSFPCAAACTDLDFLFGFAVDTVDGGALETTASAVLTQPNANGTSQSMVTLGGILNAPELKAEAFSTAAGSALAVATGATLYEYQGGSGTVEVTVNLDGDINNPGNSEFTGLAVGAGLFDAAEFALPEPGLPTLLSLLLLDSLPDAQKVEFDHQGEDGAIANTGTMTLSGLQIGDMLVLFGSIIATADGAGNSADAFETVTMEITQGAGSLVVIPVPAPLVLLSSALGLLLLRRRS